MITKNVKQCILSHQTLLIRKCSCANGAAGDHSRSTFKSLQPAVQDTIGRKLKQHLWHCDVRSLIEHCMHAHMHHMYRSQKSKFKVHLWHQAAVEPCSSTPLYICTPRCITSLMLLYCPADLYSLCASLVLHCTSVPQCASCVLPCISGPPMRHLYSTMHIYPSMCTSCTLLILHWASELPCALQLLRCTPCPSLVHPPGFP